MIRIVLLTLLLNACSNEVTSSPEMQTIPNGDNPDSPCGQIVDNEPPPYGHACCVDQTSYEIFYFDGTTTSGVCENDAGCKAGVCQY